MTTCNCTGPQNGEPLCPCAMRSQRLMTVEGRWIKPIYAVDMSETYSDMMKKFAETYKEFAT